MTNGLGSKYSSGDPVYRRTSPGGADHPGDRAAGGPIPFLLSEGFCHAVRYNGGRLHPSAPALRRRAGVLTTDRKIIDIALEFGYDSPDSFTKAFVRFHGLTPAALRKSGGAVRSFAPLRIKLTLEGGQKHGLQDYEKRGVHGALPGKDVQV